MRTRRKVAKSKKSKRKVITLKKTTRKDAKSAKTNEKMTTLMKNTEITVSRCSLKNTVVD